MAKSLATTSVKVIRNTLLILLIVVVFLYIYLVLFSKKQLDPNRSGQEIIIPQVSDQYPDETKFVQSYFSLLQKQDYESLLQSFWTPSVVSEIRQNCSNPLGEDPSTTTRSLWLNCEHLENVSIEIISVDQISGQSIVTIQFFDQQGDIVGLELHPEWVRGHQVILKQTDVGFRTDNWKFL